jgi:hypothetical protein
MPFFLAEIHKSTDIVPLKHYLIFIGTNGRWQMTQKCVGIIPHFGEY